MIAIEIAGAIALGGVAGYNIYNMANADENYQQAVDNKSEFLTEFIDTHPVKQALIAGYKYRYNSGKITEQEYNKLMSEVDKEALKQAELALKSVASESGEDHAEFYKDWLQAWDELKVLNRNIDKAKGLHVASGVVAGVGGAGMLIAGADAVRRIVKNSRKKEDNEIEQVNEEVIK